VRSSLTKTARALLSLRILGGSIGLAYAILIIAVIWASQFNRPDTLLNRLSNPPGMADRLIMLERGGHWQRGELKFARIDGNQLFLSGGGQRDYPRHGMWTSHEIALEMPSTEFIPSWNGSVPANTGVRLELRTRPRRGGWSPWLYFGSWGKTPPLREQVISFDDGAVYIDNLILTRPADLIQVRAHLYSYDMNEATAPAVRRIAISHSGHAPDLAAADNAALQIDPSAWCRNLPVPFRTQKDAPKNLSGEICSPTCVSMVMQYCGIDRPTVENATAIYDSEYDLFGNWARAVQRAGELGLDGWLQRFRNWDQVKEQIAKGQPVIASIAFRSGQFPSAVIPRTNGHLIVIRGFTAGGDVIVNDPASREKGEAAIYKADELANAWFGHGGVGYIIRKPIEPAKSATTQASTLK
jgi:Peptidase_C39 like family